ncbi:MAG: hypothetical protein Q7R87_02800 [Nanoarchaeota archaeon]|nr:hypothetical protein [Nanoarchaeota archaeon]
MQKAFNFEDHITKFVDPRIAPRRKFAEKLPSFLSVHFREKFLQEIEARQEEDARHYDYAKNAFRNMIAQDRVDISHKILHNNTHKLILTGSGLETFKMREDPRYTISEDRKDKMTFLPIDIGTREGEITLYDYPRGRNALSRFAKVTLDYHFSTEISLGGEFSSDGQIFSDKPDKRFNYDGLRTVGLYYGVPGKVALRFRDAIFNELQRTVLGTWIYTNVKRDKLKL